MNIEMKRLAECATAPPAWKKWGPYLSERQWGTVREDYSPHGNAWDYFPHDHARSRAYRWGEDGIAGFSDQEQRLCLSLALWNERDPILKERLFGLTNGEGNHGEDVKELYYYLDATPTHSYLKMLYKYPQAAFPYADLVAENRRRGIGAPEYELLDTGAFDESRYFDVFVEYAQAGIDDVLMRITALNRAPPQRRCTCCRSSCSATPGAGGAAGPSPTCASTAKDSSPSTRDWAPTTATPHSADAQGTQWLLAENETNVRRLYASEAPGPFKDAFHEYLIDRRQEAIAANKTGTKAAAHFRFDVPAHGAARVRLRLSRAALPSPLEDFDRVFEARRAEADEFYADLQHDIEHADARLVQRQALAGMIWSKQFFYFDIPEWINGDPGQVPPPPERRRGRNREWMHLNNADIISMPDKWEYPWYAAWDLAFHTIALALVDSQFAKEQLVLLTREWYMHPNGQIPAYEWAFGDVNPPVHAWATWRVFQMDRKQHGGKGDLAFLERVFHKLMLNFTWWVNRKDAEGRNVFQGGFLGLGQHRRVRPQRAAAHRRPHRPGRRHELDGDVLAEPHAHCARARPAQLRLRGRRHEILRTFSAHCRGHEQRRRSRDRAVGRRRRVLLRRAAPPPRRHGAAQGALDGRPDPAVCRRDAGAGTARQGARVQAPARMVPPLPPGPGVAGVALERGGQGSAPAAVAAARSSHEAPAEPHAR